MADFWANGTTFSFDGDEVGGLTSIGLPEQSKDQVETSAHDTGGWRTYLPGLREGGTVSLTGRIRPGDVGQTRLLENFNLDREVEECIITLPTTPAYTLTFDGFVIDVGGDAPFDDVGERTYTVKIAGEVVEDDGES